jgi:hypothetical protein
VLSSDLKTYTEDCPDGTAQVEDDLDLAKQRMIAGTFPVGTPEN